MLIQEAVLKTLTILNKLNSMYDTCNYVDLPELIQEYEKFVESNLPECPFKNCDGTVRLIHHSRDCNVYYQLECDVCGCTQPASINIEQVLNNWE